MNRERIEAAIKLMESAERLNMTSFQGLQNGDSCGSIRELHDCGNTACFAGYLALSKEFKEAGGTYCPYSGAPKLPSGESADTAVAEYLGIREDLAHALIYGYFTKTEKRLYGKDFVLVTPYDVIEKLEQILSGELE